MKHKNQIDVEKLIEEFGGIRPLANKLGIAFTTVQGWKKRDRIPDNQWKKVEKLANDENVDIEALKKNNDAKLVASEPRKMAAIQSESLPKSAHKAADKHDHKQISAEKDFDAYLSTGNNENIEVKRKSGGGGMGQAILIVGLSVGLSASMLAILFGPDFIVSNPGQRIAALEQKVETPQTNANGNSMSSGLAATLEQSQMALEQQINENVVPRLNELQAALGTISNPQNLAELSKNLENLQQSGVGQATLSAAVKELQTIVAGLQGEVSSFEDALNEARENNGALAQTLGQVSSSDLTAAAMLLALNQFRGALDRQEPLGDDIALLKSVINPDANPELATSIDQLQPFAEKGVMSSAGLKAELQALSGDIVNARLEGDNAPLLDIVKARIQSIVDIRDNGVPVLGTLEQKLVAKAQIQLEAGDVAAAKATLEQLPYPALEKAQPVITGAGQNVLAQKIEADVMRFFTQALQTLRSGSNGNALYNSPAPITGIVPVIPQDREILIPVIPPQPAPVPLPRRGVPTPDDIPDAQEPPVPESAPTPEPIIIEEPESSIL